MNEARDAPPWEGGSGGLLEVVDMMCTVTETMAQIIRKQAEMIERTKMEEAVRVQFTDERCCVCNLLSEMILGRQAQSNESCNAFFINILNG